ncbi:glycerate kinase type-2 family protein [Pelagibacterium luteolum]|uniref:Glycerate 2-kinase n=1 Tax=Pelagibacterium luteolum TaxID=440168 RepID=A0A1G7V206_9HYPH|nr:glycerate kinase [Pelagibacterium luteolum]SDG53000.1 glycerate 2-kinase [Pelagibacterium luteolum]
MTRHEPRTFLKSLFQAAVAAADPKDALRPYLPEKPKGRTIIVGAGKAASQMAAAFESLWDGPIEGVVVDRHGKTTATRQIEVIHAAHPVPDTSGLAASRRLLETVTGLTSDDLVIALMSGGGSALLPLPTGDLSFEDEAEVNRILLSSGAPIAAMNVLRKHVSAIKGGRLAKAAAPARVVSLLVSDVAGDNPAIVASGPTVPDMTTPADALEIIEEHHLMLPEKVMAHLRSSAAFAPRPDDPVFERNVAHVIASAHLSLQAASAKAAQLGLPCVVLSDAIEGEAKDIARMHAAITRNVVRYGEPFKGPIVLLSGGETTVSMRGESGGKGGRNTEFLLALAQGIEGMDDVHVLAADTDGIDGSEDNAGAFADGKTMSRMRAAGIDPRKSLCKHDAWTAFAAVDDLFVTGPTGTNVNDFRAILIGS